MNDMPHKPLPVPKGGFATNADEARWLEQTIIMRSNEAFQRAGVSGSLQAKGLYDLLLLSLDEASKRGLAPTETAGP